MNPCQDPRTLRRRRRRGAVLTSVLALLASLLGVATSSAPAHAGAYPWSSYGPVLKAGETMRCNQYLESQNLLFALYLDCQGGVTRYLPDQTSEVWFAGSPSYSDPVMVAGAGILQVQVAGATVWTFTAPASVTATSVELGSGGEISASAISGVRWASMAVNTLTHALPGNLGTRTRYLRAATDGRCYYPSGGYLLSTTCDSTPATKWTVQTNGSGVSVFVNQATGQCLSLTTAKVTTEACSDVARQKFRVLRYAMPAGGGYRYLVGNNSTVTQQASGAYAVAGLSGATVASVGPAAGAPPWVLFQL